MITVETMPAPLYQRLGGREAIAIVVDAFYGRVLVDPELAPYFAGRDLAGLRRHQAAFLAFALGGPSAYHGRTLRRAHAGLGIGDRQFDLVAGHLAAALDAARVPGALAAEVLGHVAALRRDVVGA